MKLSIFVICCLCVALSACESPTPSATPRPAPQIPEAPKAETPQTPAIASEPPASAPVTEQTHGPHASHAPLKHTAAEGCPLQKAGVNPDHLRPFEDTAKYIAHLEREDRAAWQKPDALVAALDLKGGEVVADLGAGSGYLSFRIAKRLTTGRVVALDIDPEMVRHVHHKAMSEGVTNVEAAISDANTPMIPPDTGLVLVVDVLHHVPDQRAWFAHVAKQLNPGARFAIVEFRMGDIPVGPPDAHKISKQTLLDMAQAAGLTLAADHDALLPYQHFLVFQKPTAVF